MYDNLMFSLSSALPIFLVMFMGYLLKRKKVIDESFISQANKMVFNLALPIKLFSDVSKTSFKGNFDWRFIGFIIIGTILSVLICVIVAEFIVKTQSQKGAFVQGAFRGNFLYVGYSLMENVMGSVGAIAPLAIAFVVPLYNVLGVMVLSYYGNDTESKVSYKSVLINILKNPLILSIAAGIIYSNLDLVTPSLIDRTFSYFGVLVTPLALLTIGGSFKFHKIRESFKVSLVASILKLIILPLLAVIIAVYMGFGSEEILVIYIVFGVPTAAVSYIMSIVMNADSDLASGIIMLTTLLSNITMTLFIFAFRMLGYV